MDNRKEIVQKILSELNGRSGFDAWWDNIEHDVREEITETLVNILPVQNVSKWLSIDDNQNLYLKTIEENPATPILFDDGSIVEYHEEWPFAQATDFRIK